MALACVYMCVCVYTHFFPQRGLYSAYTILHLSSLTICFVYLSTETYRFISFIYSLQNILFQLFSLFFPPQMLEWLFKYKWDHITHSWVQNPLMASSLSWFKIPSLYLAYKAWSVPSLLSVQGGVFTSYSVLYGLNTGPSFFLRSPSEIVPVKQSLFIYKV